MTRKAHDTALETVSEAKAFGGVQGVYSHASAETGTEMTFAVYLPPQAESLAAGETLPVLYYLSGLTCTHANVMEKGEYRAACAEHGVVFVAPDTSPRGEEVPDADGEYDFGLGAGFYVDATQSPYDEHYRMRAYVECELPAAVEANFPVDPARQSIMGHSMGGHGALTVGLRNPERFHSISAFSPIVAPSHVPWGEKALSRYLGEDRKAWRAYDAVALIEDGARAEHLLVEQGMADDFLVEQLQTHRLAEACKAAGMEPEIRLQEGYDHSYFFISSFMAEHVRWHAKHLKS